MNPTLIIHLADPAERTLLQDLARAGGLRKDVDYFNWLLEAQVKGRRAVFIAQLADQPCGFCVYNPFSPYGPFERLGIPEIQDLNVLPSYRRQGIARALIHHCEEQARREARDMIGIGVGLTTDYGPAQRLYVRLGYVPDGGGAVYDRRTMRYGDIKPLDDNLCLMLIKML